MASSALEEADQQAHLWCAALKTKKAAMENLLRAQMSLEKIEESIAQHLSVETIEGAHARFLSALDLNPSNPEVSYLLTIGRAGVHPLSSRMGFFRGNPSLTRSARGGSPHATLPSAPVAT